jgi:hypothetical protein
MSYPFNYPTPQYANIQIFNAGENVTQTWIKPQGASFVWFTLIGAGGAGGNTNGSDNGGGGGSGAVTNCLMPAFLIPDELQILLGKGGTDVVNGSDTTVRYTSKNTYTLLTAKGGTSGGAGGVGTGGTASTSNYFSAAGFFQSIAGQNGEFDTSQIASTTTFLSGGTTTGQSVTANYGYSTNLYGFFQMSPIIVGVGGAKDSPQTKLLFAGVGCGGGGSPIGGTYFGAGGNGLVVIISW